MEYDEQNEEIKEEEFDEVVDPEQEIFEGGPLNGQIDEWKGRFGQIYFTRFDEETYFFWRWISRREWKSVMKTKEGDSAWQEERICEICVLWPENYKFAEMSAGPAGIPTILSQQILRMSGFDPEAQALRVE